MKLAHLLRRLDARATEPCMIHRDRAHSCASIMERVQVWNDRFDCVGLRAGDVMAIQTDFSPDAVAFLLAVFAHGAVASLVPLGEPETTGYLEDSLASGLWRTLSDGSWSWEPREVETSHVLLDEIRRDGRAGFVVFSTGSTGRPKAVLHDADRFLSKFSTKGKNLRTLCFLLFDHIAGLDTLFYTLIAGGELVLTDRRDPRSVCRLIQRHEVEVLPTSPTFLRLLCLSGEPRKHDLSSLKIITYGTEPMDADTLQRVGTAFPSVRLLQKYGTSEFGSPRTVTLEEDSQWIRFSDQAVETRVHEGLLWVKARGAMLGYLNEESPFDDRGWICTGDLVETRDGWLRILGRESDVINVGGEKVYPAEVESVLSDLEGVEEVVVRGEPHPLIGQLVAATVRLAPDRPELDRAGVLELVREHCRGRLAPHKIPLRVHMTREPLSTARHKRRR